VDKSRFLIEGGAGKLEVAVDQPHGPLRGIALVAHPHPLFGGTLDNKVAQTLAAAFAQNGFVAYRMNFRGVGGSEGSHDQGRGETHDWLTLAQHAQASHPGLPLSGAGFSFGAFVMARVAQQLPLERLVLVGTAVGRISGVDLEPGQVPANTWLIHGEKDETVPLEPVMRWAETQDLPMVVIPGADHFFHRRLHHIRHWVAVACTPTP
jgi:alpha/beta superfamily hydrolase